MATAQFYLLDATYKIINGKAQVILYGRTEKGKRIILSDKDFEPYFYARTTADIKDLLLQLKIDRGTTIYAVTKVEEITRKLLEKEQTFLKIFVNIPSAVPAIKDAVKELKEAIDCYEYDIPFTRRYLLDKNITPMTLVKADIEDGNIISIEQVPNTTFTAPKILAIDIETYYDPLGKRMMPEQNPILMIALYAPDMKKVLTWRRFETNDACIEFCNNEAEMILRACTLIKEYSPDIIAGYFSDGFDLPYIKVRAEKNKVPLVFTPEGSTLRISGKTITLAEINGLIHVDVFKFIRKVISRSMKTDVFTLDAVAAELLGDHKHEVDLDKLSEAWNKNHQELEQYCHYNLHDARLTHDLCAKILPLLIEFVKLTGTLMFDVNRMSFSQLVEAYIMNNAQWCQEIAPNKPAYNEKQKRMGQRIQGAFVYEPKPGLYTNIVVFDYRSLYPSIIASHNISQGMLNCACCKGKPTLHTDRGDFWFCDRQKGFLSSIIENLIQIRAKIKQDIKQGKKDQMTLARSEALKVLANSFYGYLGFYGAKWYFKEGAEATTAFGRQYIHKVIDAVIQDGFIVIYSDTDSVFILLENKTKNDALEFMHAINKQLPGVMELDFEGMYPAGIFVSTKATDVGAKKKYALIDETGVLKIKGFETVRRNWSFIAKDVQKQVLEIILKGKNPAKAAEYLRSIIAELRKNEIPLEKVVIHTQLQREISDYKSIGPHVVAAQRMQQKGIVVEPGMILKFVIAKGTGKIRDKVRLVDESKQQDYDAEYYINNQILPAVERIFAVLGYSKEQFLADKTQSNIDSFI
ncbi:hypothetical protein HY485_05040 [Candidatus Woesearchaeota archaeon]|nr:hypothetical protein [Candidatus Woesearchaeota archaeon]